MIMNEFMTDMILTELEDAVGRENTSTREIDKLTHGVDYYWLSRMWSDRGKRMPEADFIVSPNLLPLGSLLFALFCCSKKFGWGWENLVAEANQGEGLKVKAWMRPIFTYVVPIAVIVIYVYGMITFGWE